MSTRGFTPPDDVTVSLEDVDGEPTTIDDEFAKTDAPEQEYEDVS